MLNADKAAEKWSAIAHEYENAFEHLTQQFAFDVLQKLRIQEGMDVIDVAAGTGAFSLLAALAGAKVLAADFAPGMIARLRERAAAERLPIVAEVMNGQALPVPNASFDASVSILGVIFFPDIQKGIDELRRVLRPGGRTAVVCWDNPSTLQPLTQILRAIRMVIPDFYPPIQTPTWARLAGSDLLYTALLVAGFSNIDITKATHSLTIESPERFWVEFSQSVAPLRELVNQFGAAERAQIGRAYLDLLPRSRSGQPCVSANVCIGIGTA